MGGLSVIGAGTNLPLGSDNYLRVDNEVRVQLYLDLPVAEMKKSHQRAENRQWLAKTWR